ncbi:MAG: hypothetical protein U1F59_09865 [Candidatus Competibacteraceae bacterium]
MLSKLKAENELESKLSSSPELESSELESSTMVECPVLGDLLRRISGLKRYLAGGDPTRSKLIALANAFDVNLLWLAKGEGPKQGESTTSTLNVEALRRALALVEKVGAGFPPERKARLGAALYSLYIRSGEAVDDALVEEIVRQSLGDPSQTM